MLLTEILNYSNTAKSTETLYVSDLNCITFWNGIKSCSETFLSPQGSMILPEILNSANKAK